MGKKLSNAPVYYTITLVQFNPILDMETYIPAIQAKMRDANFPDFKNAVVQNIVVSPDIVDSIKSGQSAVPTVSSQIRYIFGDMDRQSLFILDKNALSFQTTNYDTYEIFSEILFKGLDILNKVLKLQFIERIGLRYLDAILPEKENGETLNRFLIPEVLGLSLKNNERALQYSVSETFSKITTKQIISRVIIRNGQVVLPTELSQFSPVISSRFTQKNGLHAIIDTDISTNQRKKFDLADIRKVLSELHDEVKKSFEAIVTEDALNFWT
jgi:uncharacterized protein (TIGR04255 family)